MSRRRTLTLATALAAAVAAATVFLDRGPAPAGATTVAFKPSGFPVDPALILRPGPGSLADGPLVRRALELADSPEVRRQLEYLLTRKRDKIRASISRSTRYLDHIVPILDRHGLPRELAYLCIIESGYTYSARSRAGAVGIWQIIRATSRRFGLRSDLWADERLDFERSTEAAARYLVYLRGMFDDWDHVLAAYNAGEGRVRTAVARARRAGKEPHVPSLKLPRETRGYVPAFYAALLVALEPERYGIFPDYQPPLDYHVVTLPGGVDLAEAAAEMEVPLEAMVELNPAILRRRVPPGDGGYPVRIPCTVDLSAARTVAESFEEVRYVTYKVKSGDTLWDISRRFGVSTAEIDRVRRKSGASRIFPGEVLVIPLAEKGRI